MLSFERSLFWARLITSKRLTDSKHFLLQLDTFFILSFSFFSVWAMWEYASHWSLQTVPKWKLLSCVPVTQGTCFSKCLEIRWICYRLYGFMCDIWTALGLWKVETSICFARRFVSSRKLKWQEPHTYIKPLLQSFSDATNQVSFCILSH